MKTYITFGQDHVHEINNKIFDKNCVAVINSSSVKEGREKAFEIFGTKFCFEYPEDFFDSDILEFFSRGLIEVE